eukprot:141539-Heterocapsa_arctica.AAC.1
MDPQTLVYHAVKQWGARTVQRSKAISVLGNPISMIAGAKGKAHASLIALSIKAEYKTLFALDRPLIRINTRTGCPA